MIIKICGITTEADAAACARAGATALGFNFWPRSPRYVTPQEASRPLAAVPSGVLKVGVFVDETAAVIESLVGELMLDVAQVHGTLDRPLVVRHWTAYSASTPGLKEILQSTGAEAVLIDTPAGEERGGTGRTFDWSLAAGLLGHVILAGGLGPDNVAEAIAAARPWGVDASSRLEVAPGRKDIHKVRAFVEAARKAFEL